MSRMRPTFVTRSHPYTSVDVPWQIDDAQHTSTLFRYLRGGGLRAFGVTSASVARERRQRRFMWIAGIVAAVYISFLFI